MKHHCGMSRASDLLVGGLVLAVMAAMLTGCTGTSRSSRTAREGLANLERIVRSSPLSLPTSVVDIDADGRVTKINGIEAEVIDAWWERVTGTPLVGRIRYFTNDEGGRSYVQWFTDSNIQHISVAAREDGLHLLVNGMPLPYLAWDAESRDELVEFLGRLTDDGNGTSLLSEEQLAVVADFMPFISSLNVTLHFRFPRAVGPDGRLADEIPLPGAAAFRLPLTDVERNAAPLQVVDVEVVYRDVDGGPWVPSLFEFSTIDLRTLLRPFDVEVPEIRLDPDLQARVEAEGIESLALQVSESGLYFAADDRLLPHIAWNEESLANLTAVLGQLYPPGMDVPEDSAWVPIIRATAPAYNDFSIALMLRFPTGQAPADD